MTGISGYNSNSISTLFSSIGRSPTSRRTGTSLTALASTISEYNLIRSGSYKKLMTAYYTRTDARDLQNSGNSKRTNSITKDSAGTLNNVKSAAGDLQDSASKLLKTGTDSLFRQVDVKDEKGNVTKGYGMEKIYSAVESFVNDYNDVIKAADKSSTSGIQKSAISMINATSRYASTLSKAGITIDSADHRLSVDKDTFMKADISQIRSLFNGTGSFAYNVKSQASLIEHKAQNEALKANTYTSYGKYSSAFSSGSVWDRYL